jgi:hypothetical protein
MNSKAIQKIKETLKKKRSQSIGNCHFLNRKIVKNLLSGKSN